MRTAPTSRSGPRIGLILLILAWLSLLGVVGAAVGYVVVKSKEADLIAATEPSNEAPGPSPAATTATQTAKSAPAEDAAEQSARREQRADEASEGTEEPAESPSETAPLNGDTTAQSETRSEPAPKPSAPAKTGASATTGSQTAPTAAPAEIQEAALPKIEPPWRRNAQPFEAPDSRPRIAVILSGLGLSSAATEAAIKTLPGAITLAFTPYSRRLNEWVALARVNGHEVLLELPMEPVSYPNDDPGPQALLTALSGPQNLKRLEWALKRVTGYVGVVAVMGSRFAASRTHLEPILRDIKARGLLYVDNRSTEQSVAGPLAKELDIPFAVNDRFLDLDQASRVAIDDRLQQLERMARENGHAVAIGQIYPVTMERLRTWARDLESRGIVLAPISAIVSQTPSSGQATRAEAHE